MCAICAAVPTVAALGIAAEGEQRKQQRARQARGESPAHRWQPRSIRLLTVLTILLLYVLAAIYHTYQPNGT